MFTTVFDQQIVYTFVYLVYFYFFVHYIFVIPNQEADWLILIFVVPFIQQVVIFYIDFFYLFICIM